jgi:hypothetical protein
MILVWMMIVGLMGFVVFVSCVLAARCIITSHFFLLCGDCHGYFLGEYSSTSWVARRTTCTLLKQQRHQQQPHQQQQRRRFWGGGDDIGGGGGTTMGMSCFVPSRPLASSQRVVAAPLAGRPLLLTNQEAAFYNDCDPRYRRRLTILSSSSSSSSSSSLSMMEESGDSDDEKEEEDPFPSACSALGLSTGQQYDLIQALVTAGLLEQRYTNGGGSGDNGINSHLLRTVARDYFFESSSSSSSSSQQPMASTMFTKTLQDDFCLTPLQAHLCRAVTWHILKQQQLQQQQENGDGASMITIRSERTINYNENSRRVDKIVPMLSINGLTSAPVKVKTNGVTSIRPQHLADNADRDETNGNQGANNNSKKPKRPLYKQVILDTKTQQRKRYSSSFNIINNDNSTTKSSQNIPQDYGLHRDLTIVQQAHPILANELRDYYEYMTRPNTLQQERDPPLRAATADVYMRHARLFLGWYISSRTHNNDTSTSSSSSNNNYSTTFSPHDLSLDTIFPTPQKESVTALLDFMVWLRRERNIAVSYEANLWRGLIKLLKFRFRHYEASSGDGISSSGKDGSGGSGETVPAIRQARSWHRRAHQQSSKAPKQSNEDAKWLSWPQYLGVVQQMAGELQQMLTEYYNQGNTKQQSANISSSSNSADAGGDNSDPVVYTVQERRIATFYQKYLILAIFATVPDRQRTIRELEIGKSLVRIAAATNNDNTNDYDENKRHDVWCIKHAPDEYKTGGTYGERPPMYLTEVSDDIDVFLLDWRPCLCCLPHQQQQSSSQQPQQQHNFLFVQPRTGNPLTSDSVYQIVARQCYTYTGQRTNPHLLRDMIVTHVRESQQGVTEPQLEALALFMGHSVAVQRASYDRRTLTKKVAPAVNLIQQVNTQAQNNNNINKNRK